MDIEQTNALRAAAGLPLLDVRAELRRLQAVREQAAFKKYFALKRDQYAHLWTDPSRGFRTKMAFYNVSRKQLRREMRMGLT
jgi:hypothetical protein